MSSITEEIKNLQLRLKELEKQQNEKEEFDKKSSIEYNFKVIDDLVSLEETYDNRRGRPCPKSVLAQNHDIKLVTCLESIYTVLKILNNKLNKLEEK